LPRNDTKLDQYGSRVGGPIKLPGLYDGTGKAFFFFHYEELRFPNNFTKSRTILNPAMLDGTFVYGATASPTVVNVMSIAQNFANANPGVAGITTTFDPQVVKILNLINSASQTTGVINPRDLAT